MTTYMSEFIGSAFEDSLFNGQYTAQHSIAIPDVRQGDELIAICERLSTDQFRNLDSSGDLFERVFLFEDGSILVVNGDQFDYGPYESSPLFDDGWVLGGAA